MTGMTERDGVCDSGWPWVLAPRFPIFLFRLEIPFFYLDQEEERLRNRVMVTIWKQRFAKSRPKFRPELTENFDPNPIPIPDPMNTPAVKKVSLSASFSRKIRVFRAVYPGPKRPVGASLGEASCLTLPYKQRPVNPAKKCLNVFLMDTDM